MYLFFCIWTFYIVSLSATLDNLLYFFLMIVVFAFFHLQVLRDWYKCFTKSHSVCSAPRHTCLNHSETLFNTARHFSKLTQKAWPQHREHLGCHLKQYCLPAVEMNASNIYNSDSYHQQGERDYGILFLTFWLLETNKYCLPATERITSYIYTTAVCIINSKR